MKASAIKSYLEWHNGQPNALMLSESNIIGVQIHAVANCEHYGPLDVTFTLQEGFTDRDSERKLEAATQRYDAALQTYELKMIRWEAENARRMEREAINRSRPSNGDNMFGGVGSMLSDIGGVFSRPQPPVPPQVAQFAKFRERRFTFSGPKLTVTLTSEKLPIWTPPLKSCSAMDGAGTAYGDIPIVRREVDEKPLKAAIESLNAEVLKAAAAFAATQGVGLMRNLALQRVSPSTAGVTTWTYLLKFSVRAVRSSKSILHDQWANVSLDEQGGLLNQPVGNPIFTEAHARKRKQIGIAAAAAGATVALIGLLWVPHEAKRVEGEQASAARAQAQAAGRAVAEAVGKQTKVADGERASAKTAAIEGTKQALSFRLVAKRLLPERDNELEMTFVVDNLLDKDILSAEGALSVRDMAMNEIAVFAVSKGITIWPRGSISLSITSPTVGAATSGLREIAEAPYENLTAVWKPRAIRFRDGSAIETAPAAPVATTASSASNPMPADQGLVSDPSRWLSPDATSALQAKLAGLAEKGTAARSLIVDSTEDESIADYSSRIGNAWNANAATRSDLLVVVAAKDRRVRISVTQAYESKVSDAAAGELIKLRFAPTARERGIGAGLTDLVDGLHRVLSEQERAAIKTRG